MAYCDESNVLRYCSISETADMEGAISYATDVVSSYTNDIHEPLDDQVLTVTVGRTNVAYLGKTTRSVLSVTLIAGQDGIALDPSIWVFEGGRKPAIRLIGQTSPNLLVVGLEPWNYMRSWNGRQLSVTADLGPEATPVAVQEATAILAARWLCSTGQAAEGFALTAHGQREPGISSVSVEGFAVSYSSPEQSSTGVPTVDRMLDPYRKAAGSRWS